MKVAFFSARSFDIEYFKNTGLAHQFDFIAEKLGPATVLRAEGKDAICISPIDIADKEIIKTLNGMKVRLIIVRASSVDNVDTNAVNKTDITLKYLPGYSPQAIAEHAVALLLSLNRNIHIAHLRTFKGDFSIEGLMGFNLCDKTVGIVGVGRIGCAFINIMKGFGCHILAYDPKPNINITHGDSQLVSLPKLLKNSDVISLHCSLNDTSEAIINAQALQMVKQGAFLINTARGKLVNTKAVMESLNKGHLGAYGADVYEGESSFFYQTYKSVAEVKDPDLRALIQHPRVLLTAHQAFFTAEAMRQMTRTIINEMSYFENLYSHSFDRLIV